MKLKKKRQHDFGKIIEFCYNSDSSLANFSRNNDVDLTGRIKKEIECLKNTDNSFKFYEITNENNEFVGYFGTERNPVQCLTTFFIMPEFRKDKKHIWKFIRKHFPKTFFAGLFKINTRAINFYKQNGGKEIGEIMWENKPSIVFKFER